MTDMASVSCPPSCPCPVVPHCPQYLVPLNVTIAIVVVSIVIVVVAITVVVVGIVVVTAAVVIVVAVVAYMVVSEVVGRELVGGCTWAGRWAHHPSGQ